jgi:hypothetical protein
MPWSLLDIAGFVVALGNVGLGLVIGYQAYRGFRRHESAAMRSLSLGLIFLTAIAYTYAFVLFLLVYFNYVSTEIAQPLTLVYRVVQFVGLAFITYSLYIRD